MLLTHSALLRLTSCTSYTHLLTESRTLDMESAGADNPGFGVDEHVQQQSDMIQHLGIAMDRVLQNLERWERRGVPPAPPTVPPRTPLLTPPSPGPSGIRLVHAEGI